MKNPSPLVLAVARSLRSQVASGILPVRSALPSERSIADSNSVSRTVVRDAIALLASEGLVIARDRCRPVVADISTAPRQAPGRHVGIWMWPLAEDYLASSIFRGIQR